MESAKKLQPLDLLKIYGDISFEWSLLEDTIEWSGSLNRLISPDISLSTGGSFNNLLSVESFSVRMRAIDEARSAQDHAYVCQYTIDLPHYEHALLREEGCLVMEGGQPVALTGSVRFLDAQELDEEEHHETASSGYDTWTGYPTKEVLYENLASLLEQSAHSGLSGAYLAICVDRLTYLNARYGYAVMMEIFKSISERLRHEIRFNDRIGRTSSSCLGIVLQDCDRWGIVRTADRLTKAAETTALQTSVGPVTVTLSAGGVVFPDKGLSADLVMTKAEHYLFEAQIRKGLGGMATPYGESIQDPHLDQTTSQQRRRTLK